MHLSCWASVCRQAEAIIVFSSELVEEDGGMWGEQGDDRRMYVEY